MLRNNKGFTVVELIASFVFTSIIAISLFAVVLNYKDKETDTEIASRLEAFKSEVVIDVENDIQKKGLYSIDYCKDPTDNEKNLPRCAVLTFNDSTTKQIAIKKITTVDRIPNNDGTYTDMSVSYLYLEYGGISYEVPDKTNIDIVTDYFLETTTASDGLETNNPLYKIRIDLIHKDLPINASISIVASGTKYVDTSSSPYKSYNIGDEVIIQLNDATQRKFRVIQPTSGYEEFVTLLYDDDYDDPLLLTSTEFNASVTFGNKYDSSSIKINAEYLKDKNSSTKWVNANKVRLITADEVGYIVATCPKNSANTATAVNLAAAPSWLINRSYWTMTDKFTTNEEERGKLAWYVNGNSKLLTSSYVNQKFALRPVIEISKTYIANV